MNYGGGFISGENLINFFIIFKVSIYEANILFSCNLDESLKTINFRIVEVIKDENVITFI